MANVNQKNTVLNDAFEFLKRNWLIIGGLLFAAPFIIRYIKAQAKAIRVQSASLAAQEKAQITIIRNETKLQDNLNPLTQNQRRAKITSSKDLWAASSTLASSLGVLYSDTGNWYDFMNPRGWTEDDEQIRNVLLKYRNYFAVLEKLYFDVDTNSRSLRKDINKYLDPKELANVKKAIKL